MSNIEVQVDLIEKHRKNELDIKLLLKNIKEVEALGGITLFHICFLNSRLTLRLYLEIQINRYLPHINIIEPINSFNPNIYTQ